MYSVDPIANIRLARAYGAKYLPWFAPALYRCKIIITSAVNVAAIDDHFNVYWNPKAVNRIVETSQVRNRYLQELAFIWIHEIGHVLREHSQRRNQLAASPSRWNCCADLEINDSLWPGTMPPSAYPPLVPKDFKLPNGKLAEWYYRQPATKIPEVQLIDCGSGAHGSPRPWELDNDGQQLSTTEQEVIRRSVAKEMAKAAGQIPASWKVWVDQTLNPQLDWRQLLRQRLATGIAIGAGGRVDYSFRRQGRRQSVYNPVIVPTLSGQQRSQLAVVIDTSGSMTGPPLAQAVAEVYGILITAHQFITLIPCDTTDHHPVRLESANQLRQLIELPGGGGTDMRTGIQAALELRPAPDCILVITDGYTPYPTELTNVPTIFGILTASQHTSKFQRPPNPPWGEDKVVTVPTKF